MVNKLTVEPNFTLGVTGWRDTNAVWVHGDRFSTAYSLEEAEELAADILATVKQIKDAKPKTLTIQGVFDLYQPETIIKFDGYVPFAKDWGGVVTNPFSPTSDLTWILKQEAGNYRVLTGKLE